jgi:transcriptional regulator with XRE-family HTH domain
MSKDMLCYAVLADFLRTRRQHLQPDQVGVAPRARARRTAGLRREELAELVGISPDWYARLEQGKAIRVSSHVLDRLATVLQLTQAEREYVFALAKKLPRGSERCPSLVPVSDTLAALVQSQGARPAYVLGPQVQLLTWNQAAIDVLGDFACSPEPERNALWFMFTGELKQRLVDWPMHARRLIAAFRVHTCRCTGEPWLTFSVCVQTPA